MQRRPALIALALASAFASLGGLSACRRRPPAGATAVAPGATVLALGDSITHGTGAPAGASYPVELARLTGWQVVNAGVPGDTAAQVLARLPALLAEHRPALVILGAGGNDLLRRLPESDVEASLRRAIGLARDAGAQVVLVGVPRPTVAARLGAGLEDHPLFERLASELGIPLHGAGWARVLGDASLRSDAIHANAAGYRAFAEGLAATLREAGLWR